MLSRVKKNDMVVVTSGKDKGKQGSVIAIDCKIDKVMVKGIGIVTRHQKARTTKEQGKILREEGFIQLCKVMPICPSCKKACRVRVKFMEGEKKVRVCSHCSGAF